LVWWQPELHKVEDVGTGRAYLMAPQEVVDEVIEHYDEARVLLQIADLGEYKAALPTYYTGKMLEEQLTEAEEFLKFEVRLEGMSRTHEVKEFSPDGLECTLGVRQQGGKVLLTNRATGETVEAFSNTLTIVRMRYDLQGERWKGAELMEIIQLGH
jgi:hypothetical protein